MGGKGLVGLFGALTLLAGYTITWYGALMLRGVTGPGIDQGIGLTDLIFPSRNAAPANGGQGAVDQKLQAGPAPTPQASVTPTSATAGPSPVPAQPVVNGTGGVLV